MIGKNNRYLKNLKANDHFQSFSIRRLSIGTVSVAIATGVFLGFSTTNSVVQAADNPGQVNAFPNKTVNDTSTKSQETINSNSDSQRVVGESKVNDTQENATQNDTSTPTSSYAMVSERNRSKIQTDSATNSGEAKNGDSSLKNSTFVSNDTLDTKGTSNPFAQNTHSLSSNAVRATTNKLNTNSQINSIPVSKIQNKLLSVPNKARTTGFSVTDPDYPSDMWVDPNPNHYTFFGAEETRSHNQIVLSTDRTGTGIVYVTELDDYGNVIDKYTLDKNSRVMSPNTGVTIYNDDYAGLTSNEEGRNYENLVMKYEVNGDGTRNSHTFSAISFLVPRVNKQVTEYVDESGKQIVDKNGQTIPPVIQYGLDGQKYTTADNKVIQGYYAENPSNAKGYMSTFGTIGKKYHKDWHNGVTATFTQTGSDGTMSVQMYVNGKAVGYPITLKPGDQDLDSGVGNVYLRSIYIPQTIDIKYVYKKLGKIVPTDPSGKPIPGADTPTYNNDPNDPSKGGKTEVPNIPGYTPERPTVTPDNPGEDTSVIYRRIEKTSNPNNDSSTPIAPAKESKTIISSNATKETHKNDHLSLNVRNSTSKLPQTGVSDGSFTSIIGFLLLSLSSLFGLSYSKRKR